MSAQAPPVHLTQYAHSAWRTQDGVFSGSPNAIAQTNDGYIWIGTDSGLMRFDGVRFQPWEEFQGTTNTLYSVYSLLGANDGSLWIGTQSRLARLQQNKFTYVPQRNIGRINALAEDAQGTIWLARTRPAVQDGPLCKVIGEDVRCYGKADGMACRYGQSLLTDGADGLWLGADPGVCHWRPEKNTTYPAQGGSSISTSDIVAAIARMSDGETYVGHADSGVGKGLEKLSNGVWQAVNADGLRGESLQISALLAAQDGSLWIGTVHDGLYHLTGNRADHFGTAEGLSGDFIRMLFQDSEANFWVVTSQGIDKFRPLKVVSFTQRDGPVSDEATSVAALSDGTVVVGGIGGLSVLKNGVWTLVRAENGFSGHEVTSMLADSHGTLWMGIDDRLTYFEKHQFHNVPARNGHPPGQILALVEDRQQNIWAIGSGEQHRLFRVTHTQMDEVLALPSSPARAMAADGSDGIWVQLRNGSIMRYFQGGWSDPHVDIGYLDQLSIDSDGALWGWGRNGVFRWNGHDWSTLNVNNGLPCNAASTMVRDAYGNLWIYLHCGIVRFSKEEISNWITHPTSKIKPNLMLDAAEGTQSGSLAFTPDGVLSRDGRLWFAHANVLQSIDTKNIPFNALPPPVRIQSVTADQHRYNVDHKISLPALTRYIQIDYTALTYVAPQKAIFRYRLSGVDKGWQDAGSRRQAFYMNLAPGTYTFEVIACNSDGVWNSTGDKLSFTLQPTLYQTSWFKTLILVLFLLLVWLVIVLRVRSQAAIAEDRLEQRLAERDRIARELHDTLLQGFQGLLLKFQIAVNTISASEPARGLLENALDHADEVLQEGRDRVRDLRSVSEPEASLSEALQRFVAHLQMPDSATFTLHETGTLRRLHRVVHDEVLAIGREALANAFRHAGATVVTCELVYGEKEFLLICHDDGTGISEEILKEGGRDGHWGLLGMKERAHKMGARLSIQSPSRGGTTIQLSVRRQVAYLV